MTNLDIYLPILQDITAEISEAGIKAVDYPHAPFVPYCLSEEYKNAPLKIMYGGQDTYWWLPFNSLEKGKEYEYILQNERVVGIDYLKEHNRQRDTGVFWKTVERLHLMLKTGEYKDDLSALSEEDYRLIAEAGYWNYHAIELNKTLKKEGCWPPENKENLKMMRSICMPLSSVRTMISAYQPDLIYLFHWTDNDIFEGLVRHEIPCDVGNVTLFDIVEFGERHTKLVWTYHPAYMLRLGYSEEEIAKTLYLATQKALEHI